jgi:putative FmdB family regulatory protein
MPIYEFECRSCGHVWDRLQKMSDPDPDSCPDCGVSQVGRRMTAASFRLKGGGWYETDFKGEKDKKRNLVESTDSNSAGGSSAAAGEPSAPVSKPESSSSATPAPAAAPAPAPSGSSTT